jgi:hypothetical protein
MNPIFAIAFLVLIGAVVVVEVIGVQRKAKGDTLTEGWRAVDRWLARVFPWGQWFLRVFTAGLLLWAALHFGGRW